MNSFFLYTVCVAFACYAIAAAINRHPIFHIPVYLLNKWYGNSDGRIKWLWKLLSKRPLALFESDPIARKRSPVYYTWLQVLTHPIYGCVRCMPHFWSPVIWITCNLFGADLPGWYLAAGFVAAGINEVVVDLMPAE